MVFPTGGRGAPTWWAVILFPPVRRRVIEGSRTRLTVLGIVVVFLFSALFTRLWFLQVAESTSYTAAATENRVQVVYEPALRGRILDRHGRPLVDERAVDVVTFDRSAQLTDDETKLVYARLADVLDLPVKQVKERIEDNTRVSQYAPIPVQIPVSQETRTYIEEHRTRVPGRRRQADRGAQVSERHARRPRPRLRRRDQRRRAEVVRGRGLPPG